MDHRATQQEHRKNGTDFATYVSDSLTADWGIGFHTCLEIEMEATVPAVYGPGAACVAARGCKKEGGVARVKNR